MKNKLTLVIPAILALVLLGGAWVRWGYKKSELTFSQGPVSKITATDTETTLFLNPNNHDLIRIQDNEGIYGIQQNHPFQRIIISSKGISTDTGTACVKWRGQTRYVPARSFRVFSRRAFLGRLEMANGTLKEYYFLKP